MKQEGLRKKGLRPRDTQRQEKLLNDNSQVDFSIPTYSKKASVNQNITLNSKFAKIQYLNNFSEKLRKKENIKNKKEFLESCFLLDLVRIIKTQQLKMKKIFQ